MHKLVFIALVGWVGLLVGCGGNEATNKGPKLANPDSPASKLKPISKSDFVSKPGNDTKDTGTTNTPSPKPAPSGGGEKKKSRVPNSRIYVASLFE